MIRAHRTVDSLVIRTALPVEAAAVADLHARARSTYYPEGLPEDGTDWPARWREAIGRTDGQVLCAVRDARLVGIASFRRPADAPVDMVKLFQFHVDPGHWRTGVGGALHAACAEQWTADRRRFAELDVHVANERAQAFYTRQGWLPDPAHPPAAGDHHLYLRYSVGRATP
ncbi:GNAT family N-acetyltransferase [Streptomyces sp. NPDC087903]|uniref:GNAT family N-acetyltransferase n=1 Tax=Streptomyces sp. NPDC087903 TaxID=3365819 RepID=UPI00381BB974